MAAEIFAKIGDIKGESADAVHKDEIEVTSFSWSAARPSAPGGAGGGATGKPVFQDISFVHRIDKATPKLLEALATNRRFPDATITHRKTGAAQQDYLTIKLSDVTIAGVSLGDTGGGGTETVMLAFGKVDLEYKPQKPDGSLDAGIHFKFNLATNQVG